MSGVGEGVVVGAFVGAVVGLGMVFLLYRLNGLSTDRGFVVYVLVLTGRAVDQVRSSLKDLKQDLLAIGSRG